MLEPDRKAFYELVANVYAFYRVDCTKFALGVWWEGCKPFDFPAVADAFNRHAVNPDNGQFLPKPADVVKLIGGSSIDGAQVAWTKVDRAVRTIGPYQSPVFDDPIVHGVISDMGGWMLLCSRDDDAWPFVQREFETRYRGYRTAGRIESVPPLIGIIEAENVKHGVAATDTVLIGNAERARQILNELSSAPRLKVTRLSDVAANDLPQLPDRSVGD